METKLAGPLGYANAANADKTPWGRVEAINFITDIAGGTFTLQSTKDVKDTCVTTEGVKTCANNFYTKASKSNTLGIEWIGNFSGIMPLIQFVQYDTNKSNTYTIGLCYLKDKTDIKFDFITDNRWTKLSDNSDGVDVLTGINLEASTKFSKVEAYLLYSTFEKKDDVLAGEEETKVNSAGTFDDNKQSIVIGTSFLGYGNEFKPYLSYVTNSGDFTNTEGDTSTATETIINLGIKGSW